VIGHATQYTSEQLGEAERLTNQLITERVADAGRPRQRVRAPVDSALDRRETGALLERPAVVKAA
jgi:hypothetical protein